MIAVIQTGGKQYLVKEGQTIHIEKIDTPAGETVDFDKVLLVSKEDGSDLTLGNPYIDSAKVKATVKEHGRSKKVRVTKYKPKIRYKRIFGHRQHFTAVTIDSIA